jgi:RNA polymerase sigma factor (sigma-70 family)
MKAMPTFNDKSLKEAERRAREAGTVASSAALAQELAKPLPPSPVEVQEQPLVEAAQTADADAMAELVRLHWARIYGICYRRVWDKEEAGNLAREACLRVWRAHSRLKPDGSFEAYLAKTAENVCNDWWRQQNRQGALAWRQMDSIDEEKEDAEGATTLAAESITDPANADPETQALFQLAVERTMRRLSLIQRAILQLRFVLGYSRAEIARFEGCAEQNVGYHERRALKLFREFFREEWS